MPRILRFFVCLWLLSSCSGTAPTAMTRTEVPRAAPSVVVTLTTPAVVSSVTTAATSTPVPSQDDSNLRQALQQTVDRWSKAYQDGSADELKEAIDQTDLSFRRMQDDQLREETTAPLPVGTIIMRLLAQSHSVNVAMFKHWSTFNRVRASLSSSRLPDDG